MFKKFAPAAAIAGALVFAGAGFAGNGAGSTKSSTSSITGPIVVSSVTAAATTSTSTPHYGQTVTFNVSTTDTASAYVDLKCYQSGALVGEGWAAFFAGGTPGTFGLYSGPWTGGAADCTADLGMFTSNGRWKVLASTSFHVDA